MEETEKNTELLTHSKCFHFPRLDYIFMDKCNEISHVRGKNKDLNKVETRRHHQRRAICVKIEGLAYLSPVVNILCNVKFNNGLTSIK